MANAYVFNFIKIGGIWIFRGGGGQKHPLGGLHLTCDAHFRTRMSYSSQKSCVKIWFGLVEIGGMLILRWKKLHIRGVGELHVTCDAQLRTWPSYSSQKSYVKIWFGLVESFKSYRVQKQTYKHTDKHKKKNHSRNWKQYPSEKFFSGWIIIIIYLSIYLGRFPQFEG